MPSRTYDSHVVKGQMLAVLEIPELQAQIDVVLSMHSDESYILGSLKAGARRYLLKDSAESDLTHAVRDTHLANLMQS